MKQTIELNDFINAFQEIRPDKFSYGGLEHLFYWFESLEEDAGQEIELDVISICCEFSEDTIIIHHDDENVIYQQY